MNQHFDDAFLLRAIELAALSRAGGNSPFGSLLVDGDGVVLAEDHNTTVADNDVTAHPELKLARWAAANLTPEQAAATTLYTSCEPCGMCTNVIARSRLGRVVYALSAAQLEALRPEDFVALDAPAAEYVGPARYEEASAVVRGYYG